MRNTRLIRDWLCITVGATVLVCILCIFSLTKSADNLIYDRLLPGHSVAPRDDIIIIAIDNKSIAALGKFPWSRSIHAQFLSQLARAQPKAIAYDVLFTEAAPHPEDDLYLAHAMVQAKHVYLPYLLDYSSDGIPKITPPIPLFQAASAGMAQANVIFDSDGLVRHADLYLNINNHSIPHLMCRLAPCPSSQSPMPIAFQSATGAFRTASFVDVLKGQLPPILLKDKFVLIGATGDGLNDQFPAPIQSGGLMPGIELQANMLNTLLSHNYITIIPLALTLIMSLLPSWFLLCGFWFWHPRTALYASLSSVVVVLLLSGLLFIFYGYWFAPVTSLLGISMVYPLWGWRRLVALSMGLDHTLRRFVPHHQTAAKQNFRQGDPLTHQINALDTAMNRHQMHEQNAAAREEALQMLSHDMRAPQASIITLLETESQGLAPALVNQLTGYAKRTLTLAENFVQLSRIEESEYAPTEVNFCEVLQEACHSMSALANNKQIKIETKNLNELYYIAGEAGLLERVIMNLLDNAIKFSPNNAKIQCIAFQEEKCVGCTITDHGTGMSEAQLETLYARFGAVRTARNHGIAGSGLGLALVAAAVKRHHGTIKCTSEMGKGSVFTLTFPSVNRGIKTSQVAV